MSITIALAGNPNSGKTTLFNALTGANQFVGNWPGVTVEKKEGKLKKSLSGGESEVVVTDLPGIYSLSPYTLEEVVARNYLLNERPDVILNIVDGTNIERNLYLSTQLMELGIPVVMAVNMMDVVTKNGDSININTLQQKLGCEVVEISALKGTGIDKAALKAVAAAKGADTGVVHEFAADVELAISNVESRLGQEVKEEQKRFYAIKLLERDDKIVEQLKTVPDVSADIEALESTFDDDTESIITNERYTYISSIIDNCLVKTSRGKLTRSDKIDRIVTNRIAALPIFALVMFIVYYVSVTTVGTYATDWANDGVFGDGWHLFAIGSNTYNEEAEEYAAASNAVDAYLGLQETEEGEIDGDAMLAAMERFSSEDESVSYEMEDEETLENYDITVYYSQVPADAKEDEVNALSYVDAVAYFKENGFEEPDPADYGVWVPGIPGLIESGLEAVNCAEWLKGLILDGIVAGVGAVLGFVPQILVLFIFLAFLEACGYMARIAFIMDRIFRRFGLSGKSFIPMLIGSGCGIPGIMASRTIENERDRRMTIMTTTFIPCGAKLPFIAMIAGSIFGGAAWISPSAYFLGVAAVIISGIVLKKTRVFSGDPAPFVMELPAYHFPTVGTVLRSMWERGWSFIKKAGTIILLSTIVIWFTTFFGVVDGQFRMLAEDEIDFSILAAVGKAIAWIFTPQGWGNWQATVAAITGLVAKENIVGTLGILYSAGDGSVYQNMAANFTAITGYSFLVFNLLCAPCFAAMGAIKREMNSRKWFAIAISYQCAFAYVISLIVNQMGNLFTGNFAGINVLWILVAIALIVVLIYLLARPYRESSTLKLSGKEGFAR